MKMLIRTLSITSLLILSLAADGQCRIRVESPDSLPFLFSMNEKAVNQLPVLSLTLNQSASGKINFKADFPARPELSFTQVITIKKNTSLEFAIERSKGTLKFILKGESEMIFPEILEVNNDSDSSKTNASNHTGCYPVADDAAYQAMLNGVEAQPFESKKLSLLTEFASNQCIRTEQLRTMMSILTQEDNKIALLISSKNHIYDPEQIRDVLNEFYLARNKQKATEIIEAGR
jgi:hypothetical protein